MNEVLKLFLQQVIKYGLMVYILIVAVVYLWKKLPNTFTAPLKKVLGAFGISGKTADSIISALEGIAIIGVSLKALSYGVNRVNRLRGRKTRDEAAEETTEEGGDYEGSDDPGEIEARNKIKEQREISEAREGVGEGKGEFDGDIPEFEI